METTNKERELMDYVIQLATQHGDTYKENNEAKIAAKGFALGYQQALSEKNIELKELAKIVKLLLPGIYHIPDENLKIIEEFAAKSDLFKLQE